MTSLMSFLSLGSGVAPIVAGGNMAGTATTVAPRTTGQTPSAS
jgi:hypothetical protein